jgi:hypothetical protein
VFKEEYNFKTEIAYLEKDKRPQAQANLYLANFVYQYDAKNTLLIVYYAGHGWSPPSEPRNFYLPE